MKRRRTAAGAAFVLSLCLGLSLQVSAAAPSFAGFMGFLGGDEEETAAVAEEAAEVAEEAEAVMEEIAEVAEEAEASEPMAEEAEEEELLPPDEPLGEIEDDGQGICFCAWCYNVEPGVVVDYATGDNREGDPATESYPRPFFSR